MNPILKREFVVRWRDWRSHLLLLALAALLCATASWSYNSAVHDTPAPTYTGFYARPVVESIATRASRTGRTLFSTLAIGNVLVWFILAPLLTSTGVARERERGLLESLQLSHMSARSQVFSRAMSALLYLFALQLMTMPVYFVAFSFGGVSQSDILRAWLLVASTAWLGVGLGLMLSAGASRPSGALFSSVAILCGWSFAAYQGMQGVFSQWGLLGLGTGTRPLAQLLYWSHPLTVVANLCNPSIARPLYSTFGAIGASNPLWPLDAMYPICVVAGFLLGYIGLSKAARDVTRAFASAGWAGRNPLVENWKRQRQARIEAQRKRASGDLEGALLADLPFDRLIRFKNPLLSREVKGRFRLRRASPWLWMVRTGVFLFAVVGWVIAMTMVSDRVERVHGAPIILWMEWILGLALVGTFAASSFAREREAGTWESIRLSLMSSGQIARTKWASPLIAFALLTCPLWLLLFAFAPIGGWEGVPLRVLLADALVVTASLCFTSALAIWISLRARNTTTATCATLGVLLLLFGVAPSAWQIAGMDARCANKFVGVAPPVQSFYTANGDEWREQTSVRERYALETGRTAPEHLYYPDGTTYYGTGDEISSDAEVEQYQQWASAKQQRAVQAAALSGAWNPVLFLVQTGNYKPDASNPQSSPSSVNADTLVQMSLAHALVCATAILILLGTVTLRLNARPQ